MIDFPNYVNYTHHISVVLMVAVVVMMATIILMSVNYDKIYYKRPRHELIRNTLLVGIPIVLAFLWLASKT